MEMTISWTVIALVVVMVVVVVIVIAVIVIIILLICYFIMFKKLGMCMLYMQLHVFIMLLNSSFQ